MVRLLTPREVAGLIGYSLPSLRRMVARGSFPAPLRLTGPLAHPRWVSTDVAAWLAQQRGGAA